MMVPMVTASRDQHGMNQPESGGARLAHVADQARGSFQIAAANRGRGAHPVEGANGEHQEHGPVAGEVHPISTRAGFDGSSIPYRHMIAPMARAATTSDVFNAIAEPQRREILVLLRAGERPVTELAQVLGMTQPGASKHLRVLREVGSWAGPQGRQAAPVRP